MASSSSSPSAPAFSSQIWKYHVFLSFRGEDTRKTFVDHLYTALIQRGIYTYKDDETLLPGESINPSLMTAIEESQIAVIVFSKNYAESSWCLDELEYIMKCKDTRGQIVMPIFYNVDPSEVRKQKRKYGEAFVKHELENNNKVESWRKALVDASNISGWETEHIAHGHESKCIKKIVDTISHKLHPVTSSVDDNLVGVESRMHDLISKLQIGFGGKIMIGIWGVGGGGKTTLASSIYDEISSKFDGCCFVKNIREESSNKNGLEKLQAKILSGVLKQKQVEVGRVEEGRRIIKDRLHHRKVLIVLDDVDHPDHLEALAGSCDWFGEGSRVIITTRDEHVLTVHKVDLIHNISLLNNEEAMKLFCKHATRGYKPVGDYELLSKHVVSYAGGLPLALRVLGRFLCDKEMNEWRSALARLKEIPDANILEVLKISFDGLTPIEKELFLDIACFFKQGYWLNEVRMMILDACGFYPVIGVKVLIQKALITIWKGRVVMHDLVEEMAHYIVRGEHPKNPEKHSRVWKKEDVLKICAMDATTNFDRIEALSLECPESEEQLFVQTVANMKKLRWIDVNIKKSIVPYFTTSSITYIHHHPVLQTRPLPENFPPRELCCLTLNGVNQKQLWEGYKYLPNLKMINLARLWNLIKTPNFDGLPNLERFMIKESRLVQEIHPSFGHLEKLLYVAIEDCLSLKMLPPMTRSKNLETLILLGCKELFNSSKIQQNMENLEHLQQHFLPHNNVNRIGLRSLNRYLKKLDLSSCNLGDEFISSAAVWELPNLQELNLEENEFVRLNFSLLRLPRLKWLSVSFCDSLVELSELPTSIAVVYADWCSSLESLGDISKCKWLWKVSLRWPNEVGLHVGDKILRSMLQGNAKDHFITINLPEIDIWRGFVPRLDFGMKFSMPLPHDCYTDFCGLLMFIKSSNDIDDPHVNIVIKQGLDEAFESELWQEYSYETLEDPAVGYISFSSLRHNGCFNSTYNMISFSLRDEGSFGAVLIPRTSKDDPMEKTDCSEFWDDEIGERKRFRIQHDSESSINIIWEP